MNTIVARVCVIFLACVAIPQLTQGQKATEVYIPIGASPGVSASDTLLGKISRLDYEARSIEFTSRDGKKTIYVNDKTLYYLDRSAYRKKSTTGNMSDCKVGLKIEVQAADNDTAEWIKIKAE